MLLVMAATAVAQTAPPPAFEVASVRINPNFRQNDPRTARQDVQSTAGSLTMRNVPMTGMVSWAFQVQQPLISGPDGMDGQRYDIFAKAGHPAKDDEMRLMLQTLLAERFHLAVHRETRQMAVQVMLVAKSGIKMKKSESEGPMQSVEDPVKGSINQHVPIREMMDEISRNIHTPVIDMTGLSGGFDFAINPKDYIPPRDVIMAQHLEEIDIMQAILEHGLGLRMEPRKMAVEVLVIDRVDKTPTEN